MKVAEKDKWKPKSFRSIEELRDELSTIENAHNAGTLSTYGGWTPGQCMAHCAQFMGHSFDGFKMKMPWLMQLMGKLFIKRMLTKPNAQMKPGFKLPASAASMRPSDEVSVEEGLAMMNKQVVRLEAGEKMNQDSPFLGSMNHDLWVALHLNHCRMHFGFFKYD